MMGGKSRAVRPLTYRPVRQRTDFGTRTPRHGVRGNRYLGLRGCAVARLRGCAASIFIVLAVNIADNRQSFVILRAGKLRENRGADRHARPVPSLHASNTRMLLYSNTACAAPSVTTTLWRRPSSMSRTAVSPAASRTPSTTMRDTPLLTSSGFSTTMS